jgi:hypothetical protein
VQAFAPGFPPMWLLEDNFRAENPSVVDVIE